MSSTGMCSENNPASLIQERRGGSSVRQMTNWMPCSRSQRYSSSAAGWAMAATCGLSIQENPSGAGIVKSLRTTKPQRTARGKNGINLSHGTTWKETEKREGNEVGNIPPSFRTTINQILRGARRLFSHGSDTESHGKRREGE